MSACPALDCKRAVDKDRFLCFRHWRSLPMTMQEAIWKQYRRGLRMGNVLHPDYCRAAIAAIEEIARREGKRFTGQERKFQIYRRALDRVEPAAAQQPGTPREPRKDIDG